MSLCRTTQPTLSASERCRHHRWLSLLTGAFLVLTCPLCAVTGPSAGVSDIATNASSSSDNANEQSDAALPAANGSDLDASLSALAWPAHGDQVGRVAFTEERQFPFRRFPKRFAGTFDRAPNGEIIFSYTQPHSERLLLLDSGLYFEDADGQRQQLPAQAGYVRVLRDLIGGDEAVLRQDWRIEANGQGLTLYPKQPEMDRALKRIEVTTDGGRVRAVRVYLSDGVVRRYEFGDIHWVSPDQFGQPHTES